jgi:hypothetical protein
MTATATRLLEEALISQGYHGLYLDDPSQPCGCRIGDLFPCEMPPVNCRAGWLQLPMDDEDFRIGSIPPLTAAEREAAGQQRIPGLHEEETE